MNEIITQIRESLGLNKKEFALALDCSPQMVGAMESGERNPGPQRVARLYELCPPELHQQLKDEVLRAGGVPVRYINSPVCPDCGAKVPVSVKDTSGAWVRECQECGAIFEVAQ